MIYDCLIFFNELDLLEIKLNLYKNFPIKHILVESNFSFQRNRRESYFKANISRFKEFLPKIHYVFLDVTKLLNLKVTEEYYNFLIEDHIRGWIGIIGQKIGKTGDLFLVADLDEIVKLEILQTVIKDYKPAVFELDNYIYYLNNRNTALPKWQAPYLVGYQQLSRGTQNLRHICKTEFEVIKDAGYHWSSLNGVKGLQEKIQSYSHKEYNNGEINNEEYLLDCIENNKLYYTGEKMPISLTNDLPKYIIDNKERYKHLFRP